ncbi:MAG TPA: twin-arginine translocase subunit TatC [Planctomycetota bacterium]|nr:twin-arginine translocase subunit TatC [Planctomycetota bacterium]
MPDEKMMTYGQHLTELRTRLLISLGAAGGLFVVIYAFFGRHLLRILEAPITKAFSEFQLRTFSPFEVFFVVIKISFIAAFVLASPVVIHQAWLFVLPGLKERERRYVQPALAAGAVLFLAGASLCYFIVLPVVYEFFINMNKSYGTEVMWSMSSVISSELMLLFAFGLAFELPLVIVFLTQVGVVTPSFLSLYRRHAVLVILVLAAVITPTPDWFTMALLAVPLYVLFELSVLVSRLVYRRRMKKMLAG